MKKKMVFYDDFSGPTLDGNKWSIEQGGHGFGNNEAQFYTDRVENLRLHEGQLIIEGRKESYQDNKYTSAKITTRHTFHMTYGQIQVRAKLPKGKGTWPAIWMLPVDFPAETSWPACGEIDIMEHVGRDEDMIHFSLHTGLYNHNKKTQITAYERFPGISDRFATYELLWTPEEMVYRIDDQEVARFKKGDHGRDTSEMGWPFHKPYFLILNLALGGYWGGALDDSCLPAQFIIDWVKVYEIDWEQVI